MHNSALLDAGLFGDGDGPWGAPELWEACQSEDWRDKLIVELIHTVSTHPEHSNKTANLIYVEHLRKVRNGTLLAETGGFGGKAPEKGR